MLFFDGRLAPKANLSNIADFLIAKMESSIRKLRKMAANG